LETNLQSLTQEYLIEVKIFRKVSGGIFMKRPVDAA